MDERQQARRPTAGFGAERGPAIFCWIFEGKAPYSVAMYYGLGFRTQNVS